MVFYLITTSKTYDIEKQCQIVGGVQTYSRDLCLLAMEKGFHAVIYQLDSVHENAQSFFDGIEFHIIHKRSGSNQKEFNKIYAEKNAKDTIFVIATDQMDIKTRASNVIVIQHGVAFDTPTASGLWGQTNFLRHANKFLRCLKNVQRLYWSKNTVGVDYNYFNWFRTLGFIYPDKQFTVIPNYSSGQIDEREFANKMSKRNNTNSIKIVFARRFADYRGTLLFANCVDRLLKKYSNLDFTFAGDGPLKGEIETRFNSNPNVHVLSFSAPDSIDFHKQYDIAVVPTIYSEGTSLSLLEAMSAGCFPIATHVGGITNIIIDNYNGLLCYPDEESVYSAIEKACTMENDVFIRIVSNA